MAFSEREQLARLRLIRTHRVGPVSFHQLIQLHGSAENAVEHLSDLARHKKSGVSKPPGLSAIHYEIAACEKAGVQMLFHGDTPYPKRLSVLDDAPPVLFVVGNTSLLHSESIGVVGTRNASAAGLGLINHIIPALAKNDLVIVSGMAKGIDAAAHHASIETGTIACLAGGIDVIYPRQNTKLYGSIKDRGCIISEMPLGEEPQARHFPRRNRLISGLSLGVLVIEATERSGSLITARLAGEQGREVMAVPGSPLDPRSAGPNKLLKEGAALITNADDVLSVINPLRQHHRLIEPQPSLFTNTSIPDEPTSNDIQSIKSLLSPTPIATDKLIDLSGLSPAIVQAALLSLELGGSIERLPGGRVIGVAK